VDFAHYAYGDKTTIAGAPVQAIFGGVVAAAIADSWPYGNFVLIESTPDSSQFPQLPITASQSLYHLYAHLEQPPNFQIGEAVTCGQNLGTVGNTGWSGNYHLHIETRLGPPGVTFEGMAYYQTTATAEERANYARWRFGGEFAPFDPFIVLIP
jgi:murein DD-endopeptidase MepM/ murein hydrolase activator NlpD